MSGQLPPQFHVIMAHILRCQTERGLKEIRVASLVEGQSRESDATRNPYGPSVEDAKRSKKVDLISVPGHYNFGYTKVFPSIY